MQMLTTIRYNNNRAIRINYDFISKSRKYPVKYGFVSKSGKCHEWLSFINVSRIILYVSYNCSRDIVTREKKSTTSLLIAPANLDVQKRSSCTQIATSY